MEYYNIIDLVVKQLG